MFRFLRSNVENGPRGEIGKHKALKMLRFGLPVQVRPRAPNIEEYKCVNQKHLQKN